MSRLDSLTNLYKLKPPPSCPVSATISSPLHVRKVTTSGIRVQEEGLWCHLYVSGIRKDVLCFLFSSSSTWCLGDPFTPLCALLTAFTPKILLMWIPRSLSKGKTLLKTSKAMESVIVINRIQAKTWARGMAYQFLKTKTLLCETRWFHALCTIYMKITKVFVKGMNECKKPKTFFLCCVIPHTTDNFSLDSLWKFRRMILFNKVQSREKNQKLKAVDNSRIPLW